MAKRTAAPVEPSVDTPTAGDIVLNPPPVVEEESEMSVTHTYPDGSAVVGRPPWPEKSPIERARDAAEGKAAA